MLPMKTLEESVIIWTIEVYISDEPLAAYAGLMPEAEMTDRRNIYGIYDFMVYHGRIVSYVPEVGSFPIKLDIYERAAYHALQITRFYPEVTFIEGTEESETWRFGTEKVTNGSAG